MRLSSMLFFPHTIAPCTGAWIETILAGATIIFIVIAPCTGAD